MSQAFDPYRKWLGIPPAEQPADHYRLLGVGRFEDDLDTISNAADRQMAHVRTFQTGPNSALSQRLLNEIAAARICLLDRTKKAAYDRDLRAKQGSVASVQLANAPPVAQPFALPIPAPNQPVLASLRPRGPARKKSGPMIPLLAGSLLLIAIIVGVVVLRRGGEEPASTQLTGQLQPRPAPSIPAADPDAATSNDTAVSVTQPRDETRQVETAHVPKLPPANLEIIEARWGEGEHWQDITARIRSLVHDQRLVATVAGSLFKDIADPAVGTAKRVRIRYRTAGEPAVVDFADGALIYLDGHPHGTGTPSSGGLQVLEARYGIGATWIDVLPRVSRWIHGDRLAMRVEFVAQTDPAYQQRKTLFMRYRTGDGEYTALGWDGDEVVIDARSAVAGKAVDLMKAIDPLRDSTGGLWRREGAALIGPERESGNLTVRAALPKEYLLRVALDAAPRPNDVGISLPIGDGQVQLVLDGWWSSLSGLQNIDGLALDRNASQRRGTMFVPGQTSAIECVVRKSSIYVTCNGRVAVDWRGDRRRLLPPAEAQASGKPAIVLRGLGTPWRVSRLEAAPLREKVSPAAPSTPGKTVDLIKLVDLKLDSVAGKWELTDQTLVSAPGEGMRLQIPYSPPEDYELRLMAAPRSGDNALLIGLIVDGRQTAVIIDGWSGGISGLNFLDGQTAEVNATRHEGRVFVDEQPREVVCTVHPDSVRVTCEDGTLVDWHGDARRLSMEQRYAVPDELGLWLGDWNTTYLISRFELRALPPEPAPAPIALTKPVDLLSRIDPKRDAVRGEWRREGQALLAPATQWARLQIPILPPEEYTLTLEAVGNREIDFGIVVGGHQAEVVLDGGERGEQSGMQNIGGQSADRNATTHQGKVLHETTPNTIVCTVHKADVEVVCNGQRVIQWAGDPRSLSLPQGSLMPDERRLFLRCWDAAYRVTRLELSAPRATAPVRTAPVATAPGTTAPKMPDKEPRSFADLAKQPPAASAADTRLPVPTGQSLAAADKKVDKLFAPRWKAAKTFAKRLAVARELYDMGMQTTDDTTLRYALLREARGRAAALGDISTACDSIEQLGREFQIDPLADKLSAMSEAIEKAHVPSQVWTIALGSLLLAERALSAESYDEARKFASLAAAAGRRTRHHDLIKYAEHRLAEMRGRQEQHERFKAAIDRLREQPDDAAANLEAGRYRCLVQGDWPQGLPLLAKSGDAELAEIAKLETVAEKEPKQRAALVEAWLAAAEKQTGILRVEYQLQAKYWLDRGLPAETLPMDAGQKRAWNELREMPGISLARLKPGLAAAMFEGADFQQFRARRVDAQICFGFGSGSPHPSLPSDNFSIRWTGWLKPPLPGKYVLKTNSDDSVRVRIGGKLVIDHWGRGAGDETAEVELADEPQPITVEYNDYQANADVCLRWSLKDFSDLQVVPAEALFHDPARQSGE